MNVVSQGATGPQKPPSCPTCGGVGGIFLTTHDLVACAADDTHPEDAEGYGLLRDTIIDRLNPRDDDVAEVAILTRAVGDAAAFIEKQKCFCKTWDADHDPCDRCRALGRLADVRVDQ